MAEEYLNFSQALDALEITETELWELIHSGTLKAYRAGGVIKFKKSDIIAYQKSRGTEPTIVVSRKMLDSMETSDDDEEGIDTEVGLRAARRPSADDLATSEVTVKEPAVRRRGADSDQTAPVAARPRRASARGAAGAPAPGARSSRISQVLETEKKGNPIINVIMILAIIACIYQVLILYATARNEGMSADGKPSISRPGFIFTGLYEKGLDFGAGKHADDLRTNLNKYSLDISKFVEVSDNEVVEKHNADKEAKPEDAEEPEETPEEGEPAEEPAE